MGLSREDSIGLDSIVLLVTSIIFGMSVIKGNVGGAVVFALFMLMGVSLLIRDLVVDEQRSDDPAQIGRRKALLARLALVVSSLAFGTLCTATGVKVTIAAVHASGGERVFYVVVAVLFYLFAALLIVGTILGPRLLPGDAATPENSENRAEGPDNLHDSSANRQQNLSDHE